MLLNIIANNWQKALPALALIGTVVWIVVFRHDPTSERALFTALLVIYMVHQIEEHLWPGGFRQFANACVFRSGDDNWPVDIGGVALVNIGFVWLPLGAAVLWPDALHWVDLGWIGLTLINSLTHIATSLRFRRYNPGLVTSIVLLLPFTAWMLAHEAGTRMLSDVAIGWLVVIGVLLHLPVAALFVVPFRRGRSAAQRAG
jgi:hypothetical protein